MEVVIETTLAVIAGAALLLSGVLVYINDRYHQSLKNYERLLREVKEDD